MGIGSGSGRYTGHMNATKRKRIRGVGAFTIAATYVGTVVGAGFASGQEVLQFFTAFGRAGLLGLLVSLALFVFFGIRVLALGRSLRARSHRPLLRLTLGRFATAVDLLLVLFLLVTTAAMAAGAGSTGLEQYGWPRWQGSTALMAVTVFTVLAGVPGVVTSISLIAPVLIVAVLVIAVVNVTSGATFAAAWSWSGDPSYAPVALWFVAAPLYVAYNLVLAIPVLAPLGERARSETALHWGGMLGGTALAVGAAAIHLSVAGRMPAAAALDIPMLHSARTLPGWVPLAYSVLLLAEIYTTAVATLFGFAARIGERGRGAFQVAVVVGGLLALVAGQFRFATIVGTFYPLMGIVGAVILAGMLTRR